MQITLGKTKISIISYSCDASEDGFRHTIILPIEEYNKVQEMHHYITVKSHIGVKLVFTTDSINL